MTTRRTKDTVARDLMTAPAQTCLASTTLNAACRRMQDAHCATLVVVDDRGRTAGLLTEHDVTMALAAPSADPGRLTVAASMRPSVPTCAPDEPVREVLERMALTRAPRLPVVGADGDLHGLLSIDDIVLWAAPSGAVSCQDLLRTLRSLAVARLPAV